ncbi:triphosphoribosyl-dephospho-CoA synthase [Archaeoglobales archaeon]|nr:MAG: triphosphoribosyl-dephospho-CoA synthase [Archaeoglobales archaeon]
MFKNEYESAIAAVQSMLLEVSGNPKAGNVDREHDFEDLKYEHFIVSSVSSFPIFLNATFKRDSIGKLILEAVKTTSEWHKATNVHFGAFLLLIPLLTVWNSKNIVEMAERATDELKKTTHQDSIAIFRAFKLSSARVLDVEDLSLESNKTEEYLASNNINVYEWMKLAPKENLIAKELINSYRISLKGCEMLLNFFEEFNDVNVAVVLCYHTLLSEYLDPLIISKSKIDVAELVRNDAKSCLEEFEKEQNVQVFKRLDEELIRKKLNPGTIADLTISSIYFALAEGWRF